MTGASQLSRAGDPLCAALRMRHVRGSVIADGTKLGLIYGGADLVTDQCEHATAWFSENWPGAAARRDAAARQGGVKLEVKTGPLS